MRHIFKIAFAVALFTGCASSTKAFISERVVDSQHLDCGRKDALYPGPYVASPEVARAIFRAFLANYTEKVIPGTALAAALMRANVIEVRDGGDHWALHQTTVVGEPAPSTVTIETGGGISMKIDKCSGTISSVRMNR